MSGSDASYRIIDEPEPRRGPWIAVNPFWPLIATALSGVIPGLLWMAYNAQAIGSATRRREFSFVLGGILGAAMISALLFSLSDILPRHVFPYLLLLLVAWKMFAAYFTFLDQEHSLELFAHYGGRVRNGLLPMIVVCTVARLVEAGLSKTSPALGALFFDRGFLW